MSTMLKKDWQAAAKSLNIKFQKDDTVKSLQERIAYALGVKAKKGQSLSKLLIDIFKPKAKPAKKSDKKASEPKANEAVVKFQTILDDKKRDSILVTVGKKGHEAWLRRRDVKVDMKNKEVTVPKWLAEVKGLL